MYGSERMHPIRAGRSPQQMGRNGLSNHRWIVGGKLCLLLKQWGVGVGWACATAHIAANTFQWLIQQVDGRMIVLSDTAFHREGAPGHLHHASCNCTRLSGTLPTVCSSMTGSWHWNPGRAHGDRCIQHAGTAGDRPDVCRPHALVLDGSPARRQPLCRWASRQTPRNEPCGVRRHPVRWGGRGEQAALLILEGKG
jgi:hypothetical protein